MTESENKILQYMQHFHGSTMGIAERHLMLSGRQACWNLQGRKSISSLAEVEFTVFSQWGEDGIIEWLVQNLPLKSDSFVEFGVENYSESNTRFLLQNRNFKGLVFDGDAHNIEKLLGSGLCWRHHLTAQAAFITRDNINDLISKNGFSGDLGILSIDIDGNDYWVWEAIDCVDPEIVILEYNAVFGDKYPVTIPYDPEFVRTRAHSSNLYWGTSIKALESLASAKGYRLIGTNAAGNNAFFLRQDMFARLEDKITDKSPVLSRLRESRDEQGNLTFVTGTERFEVIKSMPVVRVDTGETISLESLAPVYSDEWAATL